MEALPLSEASPYLRRTIAYNNSDCTMVYQNLQKVRSQWVMIVGVMAKTGETVWARGMMYKSVIQLVLLYRSEIWVVMG